MVCLVSDYTVVICPVLCKKKGVDPAELGTFDRMAYKDQQYDLLAKHMRENMDMDLVYRIINEQ